jgi:hypothetical protein
MKRCADSIAVADSLAGRHVPMAFLVNAALD